MDILTEDSVTAILNTLFDVCDVSYFVLKLTNKYFNDAINKHQIKRQIIGGIDVNMIAEKGYLNVLIWAKESGSTITDETFIYATKSGNLDMLEWLQAQSGILNIKDYRNTDLIDYKYGRLEELQNLVITNKGLNVLKWINSKIKYMAPGGLNNAIFCGRTDIFNWIINEYLVLDEYNLRCILQTNRIKFVVSTENYIINCMISCDYNALNNIIDIINHDANYPETFWHFATTTGNIEMLEWVGKNIRYKNDYLPMKAASNGHLDALKWLLNYGYKMNATICTGAICSDQYDVFDWACQNGCVWGGTMKLFVRFGNIHLDSIWIEGICCNKKSQYKLLKWAISGGYVMTKEIKQFAMRKWPGEFN